MVDLFLSLPSDEAYWQRIFAEGLCSTEGWVQSAQALRLAIDAIADRLAPAWQAVHDRRSRLSSDLKLHPVVMMLCSYAAENYLKARIVTIKGWTTSDIGEKLPKLLKSHDIAALAESAGAVLNAEEVDLVNRLSVYGVWAGRYPSPQNREDLRPRIVGTTRNLATFFRGSDISVARCLLEKLESLAVAGSMPLLERQHNVYDGHTIQERVRPW